MNDVWRLVLAAAVCFAAGCGGGGKPAAGALVVFHPATVAVEKQIGGKPFGKVKDDGTVPVTTYEEADGAPPGEYGVTVQWAEAAAAGKLSLSGEGAAGKDKLGNRYGDPQNPRFKFTVKKGEPNKLELTLD